MRDGGGGSTGADLSYFSLAELPRGGRRWCESEEEALGEAATLLSSPSVFPCMPRERGEGNCIFAELQWTSAEPRSLMA